MIVGKKSILIKKNINEVKNDLEKLTKIRDSLENYEGIKIFWGNINGNKFIFYCKNSSLQTPELHGKLLEKDGNETLVKIDIVYSLYEIIIHCFIILFSFYYGFIKVLPKWSENNIYLRFLFIFMVFIFPISLFCFYFYNFKNMLDDLYLYCEGYYDKYIK